MDNRIETIQKEVRQRFGDSVVPSYDDVALVVNSLAGESTSREQKERIANEVKNKTYTTYAIFMQRLFRTKENKINVVREIENNFLKEYQAQLQRKELELVEKLRRQPTTAELNSVEKEVEIEVRNRIGKIEVYFHRTPAPGVMWNSFQTLNNVKHGIQGAKEGFIADVDDLENAKRQGFRHDDWGFINSTLDNRVRAKVTNSGVEIEPLQLNPGLLRENAPIEWLQEFWKRTRPRGPRAPGVYIIGIKPPPGTPNIEPFSSTSWYAPVKTITGTTKTTSQPAPQPAPQPTENCAVVIDLEKYAEQQPDVKAAFTTDGLINWESVRWHATTMAPIEGRPVPTKKDCSKTGSGKRKYNRRLY